MYITDRQLQLLVVDDLDDWRKGLTARLRRIPGVLITEARSGEEAVEQVGSRDFDLVLLDLKMPSYKEGLEALTMIKEIKPQTEVIIMTAYGDIQKTADAFKLGARDFLPKDTDFDDIVAHKIDEFISRSSLIADRELLIKSKYKEVNEANTISSQGQALEELLAALLASIEGFIEIGRDVRTITEEIDLVFRNNSRDPFWQNQGSIILVECKNWKTRRPGKNEYVALKEKMQNRFGRCKLGFLVCVENFASTLEKELLRSTKTNDLIVLINGGALRKMVESDNRNLTLRNFVEKAILQ
jgi:DNA-binding NarL/FixJ family response regulator